MSKNILVIKLGALGDFIYALGPMAAIRRAHPNDRVILLTTAPYERLGRECHYFDDVIIDEKPSRLDIFGWMALRKRLNNAHIDRVYDLQNNDRTGLYFRLFSPRPEWVGAVKGASHRNASPDRSTRHAFYGHQQTLAIGEIHDVQLDPLAWMKGHRASFGVGSPYALLVSGCSPQNPGKRWPAENFRALAGKLIRHGITPVLIGTKDEADITAKIARGLDVIDLTGRTALFDIPDLARGAVCAIGNDTGPMHMAAVTGCPIVMLFSNTASNVTLHAPPFPDGTPQVKILSADQIRDIKMTDVFESVLFLLAQTNPVERKSG